MREVVPRLLWIGNARDVRDIREVLSHEIGAVVQVAADDAAVTFPRDIIFCHFPLLDGAGNPAVVLKTAVHTVALLARLHMPTLVTCSNGMSRSPAIAAAGMAVANRESPDEWLKRIAATGPHDVGPGMWNEIRSCVTDERTGNLST
jgi:hypothetical protein